MNVSTYNCTCNGLQSVYELMYHISAAVMFQHVFSRYDLYNVEVSPQERIQIGEWLTHSPNYFFIRVRLDEVLFEGGRSIRYVTDI